MPFYEYQCAACGHHHEELQKVSARPLRKCPSCGKSSLKRLVSAPVFRLKGGGWYETDFKGDKDGKRNLAGDKEPVPEKPKDEKADAKPATDAKPAADAKPATEARPTADARTAETAKPSAAADPRKPTTTPRPKVAAKRSSLRRRRSRT